MKEPEPDGVRDGRKRERARKREWRRRETAGGKDSDGPKVAPACRA